MNNILAAGQAGFLGLDNAMLIVLAFLPYLWPAWRTCKKAGFPGPLALTSLLPPVFLLVLAFADWPALRQNRDAEALI